MRCDNNIRHRRVKPFRFLQAYRAKLIQSERTQFSQELGLGVALTWSIFTIRLPVLESTLPIPIVGIPLLYIKGKPIPTQFFVYSTEFSGEVLSHYIQIPLDLALVMFHTENPAKTNRRFLAVGYSFFWFFIISIRIRGSAMAKPWALNARKSYMYRILSYQDRKAKTK